MLVALLSDDWGFWEVVVFLPAGRLIDLGLGSLGLVGVGLGLGLVFGLGWVWGSIWCSVWGTLNSKP